MTFILTKGNNYKGYYSWEACYTEVSSMAPVTRVKLMRELSE